MGFYDTPNWARRLVEDEARRQDELDKLMGLSGLRDAAARQLERTARLDAALAKEAELLNQVFGPKTSAIDKAVEDDLRHAKEWATANAMLEAQRQALLQSTQSEPQPSWFALLDYSLEIEPIDDRMRRIIQEELTKRDPKPVEVDPELYGRDGVRRRPGFKAPADDEDDEK